VPGDLLTDLQLSGVIGDPLYENNFAPPGTPVWDAYNWTYTTSFNLEASTTSAAEVYLVFDGCVPAPSHPSCSSFDHSLHPTATRVCAASRWQRM